MPRSEAQTRFEFVDPFLIAQRHGPRESFRLKETASAPPSSLAPERVTTASERGTDQRVYPFHGMTPDEIRILEDGAK
jgi:hypothetical protein